MAATNQGVSGGFAYYQYGWETTFGTEGTLDKAFGHGVDASRTARNSPLQISGLGNRNVTSQKAGRFEGDWKANFSLASGAFWKAVLGAVVDAGVSPYTHTFTETNDIPSMSIDFGVEDAATDSSLVILGAKTDSCNITGAIDNEIKVSLDGMYKTETQDATLDATPATETEDIFTFSESAVTLDSGGGYGSIGVVQNFELSIKHNLERIYGFESRFPTAIIPKKREYTGKITIVFTDPSKILDLFYGGNGAPASSVSEVNVKLTITNGGTGAALRKHEITITGLMLSEHTLNGNVDEIVIEDVPFVAKSLGVVYTDNTAATP